MSQLRLYTFVNFYLSAIQQGIQSAHLVHELFLKYRHENIILCETDLERLYDWAENHKTMIVLNGGINKSINELFEFFRDNEFSFNFPTPFACFHEDEMSLGGVMTCVGIVLPEEIYDAVDYRQATSLIQLNMLDRLVEYSPDETEAFYYFNEANDLIAQYSKDSPEWKIIKLLKSCPLAR